MAADLRQMELSTAFQALLDSTNAAIIAVDREGQVVLWSEGAERIFGWSEDEALGRFLPPMPAERRDEFRDLRTRVLSGEPLEGIAMRHQRKDGSEVAVLLSLKPLHGSEGNVRAILGLATEASGSAGLDALGHRVRALELELAEMEHVSLQRGLPAHFLLAVLHTASMLLRTGDQGQAVHALTRAGRLLRRLAAREGRPEVPLREELDLLEEYVELERLRFDDRLRFEAEAEAEVESALVPRLLLFPLVENAVEHGLAARPGSGTVSVRASRANGQLQLEVRDDGRGLPRGWRLEEDGGEEGLRALRQRLRRLYGDAHRLEVRNGRAGGVVVSLSLPFRSETSRSQAPSSQRRTASSGG